MPKSRLAHDVEVIDVLPVTVERPSGRAISPSGGRSRRGPTRGRRIRLKTLEDVAREMGRCYREARSGEINSGDLSGFVYALGQLGRVIEAGMLEQRVQRLEVVAAQQGGKPRTARKELASGLEIDASALSRMK